MLSENQREKIALSHLGFEDQLVTSDLLSEEKSQQDCFTSPDFWIDMFPDYIFQDLLVATDNSLVWRGCQKGNQAKIALKITENFQNESSKALHQKRQKTFFTCHSLTHTVNIISVVDKEDYRLVAMELYPWTLETIADQFTNKHKRFDEQHIKFVGFAFRAILTAVEELHSLGYVHRDLKLDNFMVSQKFNILLNDLELVTQENQVDSSLCGTADYMPPERLEQKKRSMPIKRSVDIWSLGIILFELLTGSTPFNGDCPDELVNDIYFRQAYNKSIPQQWNSLIQGMLQIKPENRLTIEQIKASRVLGGEFDMSLLSKVMKK